MVQILLFRILHGNVRLWHCTYISVVLFSILYEPYGFLPTYCDGVHGPRKHYGITQRKDGKRVRQFSLIYLHEPFTLHDRYYVDLCP